MGVSLGVIAPSVGVAGLGGGEVFDVGKVFQGCLGGEFSPEGVLGVPAYITFQIELAAAVQIGIQQGVIQRIRVQDIGCVAPAKEAEDRLELIDVVMIRD